MSSVLLLGDILVDRNLIGYSTNLTPEAPVPIVNVETTTSTLGGIGNVVRSLTNFFYDVHFISSFHEDDARMVQELFGEKVCYTNFEQEDRRMVVINRVMVGNQLMSRFDYPCNTKKLSEENEDEIVNHIMVNLLDELKVVILSDYDRGFLTKGLCTRVIKMCKESGVTVLVDPILPDWTKFEGATLIKPNREELNRFIEYENMNSNEFAETTLKKHGFSYILSTLDNEGMVLFYKNEVEETCQIRRGCAENLKIVDVNGCGDALITATAVFLQQYKTLENHEQSLIDTLTKVGKVAVGTSGCYILNSVDFERLLKPRKVVFTNGCFDVIHVGHLKLLNYSRGLGDHLIIGINSDNSIKLNKGGSRPINNLESRNNFLKELNIADEIITFEDKTPIELIKAIRPDVLVKGGDYTIDDVVGREIAGSTVIFPLENGVSSTAIIKKIATICQKDLKN